MFCANSSGDRVAHSECEGRGFDSLTAHHFATKARRTAGLLHSVGATFVLGNRIAFAYTPSYPYPSFAGFSLL